MIIKNENATGAQSAQQVAIISGGVNDVKKGANITAPTLQQITNELNAATADFSQIQLPDNVAAVLSQIRDKYPECSYSLIYNYLLCAVGAAVGGGAKFAAQWENFAPDYFVNVAAASTGKSVLSGIFFEYLQRDAANKSKEYRLKYAEWQANKSEHKGEQMPKETLAYSNNATPEKIAALLSVGGMLLYVDEFANMFESYGQAENSNLLNEWFNQSAYFSGRISNAEKGNIGGIMIENVCLSLLSNTQTIRLKNAITGTRIENGFVSRLLFSYTPKTNKKPISADAFNATKINENARIKAAVANWLQALREQYYNNETTIFTADSAAANILTDAINGYITKVNETTDTGLLYQYYNRAQVHLLRLALCFALLRNAATGRTGNQITAVDAQNAVTAMNCYLSIFENDICPLIQANDTARTNKQKSNSALAVEFGERFGVSNYELSKITKLNESTLSRAKNR